MGLNRHLCLSHPPQLLPGLGRTPLLLSRLLVTFHQKSRSRGGSEWQGEMRAAGGMVLPLCHHIRPLNDSSWCQALGNTGNESHPRALAPAGAFRDGLAQERPGARGFSSVCGREGGGTLTPGTFFFRFGLVFLKAASPPKTPRPHVASAQRG